MSKMKLFFIKINGLDRQNPGITRLYIYIGLLLWWLWAYHSSVDSAKAGVTEHGSLPCLTPLSSCNLLIHRHKILSMSILPAPFLCHPLKDEKICMTNLYKNRAWLIFSRNIYLVNLHNLSAKGYKEKNATRPDEQPNSQGDIHGINFINKTVTKGKSCSKTAYIFAKFVWTSFLWFHILFK